MPVNPNNVPISLIEANKAWNQFAMAHCDREHGGDGWLAKYYKKVHDINGDQLITDIVRNERLKEWYEDNLPNSRRLVELRQRLLSRENLPTYKQQVDKHNLETNPTPYWPLLIDETLPGAVGHEANPTQKKIYYPGSDDGIHRMPDGTLTYKKPQ